MILTTKYKYGMLKPTLVKKFEIVYKMKIGSLSNVKSNICLMVFLASVEQQIPSENWSSSTELTVSATKTFVFCDIVLRENIRPVMIKSKI